MDDDEDEEKMRKIVVDVIDTPRGLVPTAESIRNLIEALNESFQLINENLNKMASYLARIDQTVLNLSTKLSTTASKLDLLFTALADLKVSIENLYKKIDKIERNPREDALKTSDERTYDLLKNILFQKEGIEEEGSHSSVNHFRKIMKPIEFEGLDDKLAIRNFLKHVFLILETEPYGCLKAAKSIAVSSNWESYYIDLDKIVSKEMKGFHQFIKYIVDNEKRIVLAILNSHKVIGLPDFVVSVSESIKLIDYLTKINPEPGDKIILFQTDSIEKIDPVLLNKIRQVTV